jgi:UDP-N-acetylglucosamine 4,6-dehydratase
MSKSILITGGTGSFGREFVKLLLEKNDYHRIVIYSRDEQKQEQMRRELVNPETEDRLRFFLGDVRDKDRLKLALKNVDDVVHAAALKIVPTGEYNPTEFVKTNILGAQNIVEILCEKDKGQKLIALSTDKSVWPINLYGATKLVM